MNKKLIFPLILFYLFFSPLLSNANKEKRALLIGISKYQNEKAYINLPALSDLALMRKTLLNQGFAESNILKLRNEQATKKGINSAIDNLIQLSQKGDKIVIHFSVHGEQITDLNGDEKDKKDECLIPFDAPGNFEDTSNFKALIIDDEIDEWITLLRKKIGSEGHILLLLESCHSGTAGRGNGKLNNFAFKENYNNLLLKSDYFENTKPKEIGLGKYVLFSASQAYERNFHTKDDNGNEIGSLTYALAKAFEQLPKDATYSTLFDMVKYVMAEKRVIQTPVNDGDVVEKVFSGDFIPHEPTFSFNTLIEKGKEFLRIRGKEDSLAFTQPSTGKTWAILVGISDYKNIKDLQFADRDAEVFYGYLNEVAKVPKENIFLFTNQRADRKNVFNALTNIDTLAESGDKFIFFFAGHGDIEAENQPDDTALLLLHNSSNGNYLAEQDGYIKLTELREAFNQFTDKNISVQFYADACRSGAFNLMNNSYSVDTLKGGLRGRNKFLKGIQEPWLNQIKFVSCQVNQNALEGSEFSCGRGLFSLHLIDGLMGMADGEVSKDGKVTFQELQLYVGKKVSQQALPRIQNPISVSGDNNEEIAEVDSIALANYQLKQQQFTRTHQADCSPFLSGTNIKGDSILVTDIDQEFRADYIEFYQNLRNENLLFPTNNNAKKSFLDFEEKLKNTTLRKSAVQFLKIIAGNMKADLIEGLQKGCMNIIKPLLFNVDNNYFKYAVHDTAHRYMTEALKLIPKEHFLYNSYLARDLYLQTVLTLIKPNNDYDISDKNILKADSLLRLALVYETDMPYIYSILGGMNDLLGNLEQALSHFKKGFELMPKSPSFLKKIASIYKIYYGSIEKIIPEMDKFLDSPSINEELATYYTEKNDSTKAKIYLAKALIFYEKNYNGTDKKAYYYSISSLYKSCNYLKISKMYADSCYNLDSTSFYGLMAKAPTLKNLNDIESAKPYIKKIINYFPDYGVGHFLMALTLMAKKPTLAIQEVKIGLKKIPNSYWGLLIIIPSLIASDSIEQAYQYAKHATKLYPKAKEFWKYLGSCSIKLKKDNGALLAYMKSDSLNPNNLDIIWEIGITYSKLRKYSNAIPYFIRSLQINPKRINTNLELGYCYWKTPNQLDSAIYFFKKEIENNPPGLYAYIYLGFCYEQMSTSINITKALEYFKIGIKKAKEVKNVEWMNKAYSHSLTLLKENIYFQEKDIISLQEIADIIDDKKVYEDIYVGIVVFYEMRNEPMKAIPYLLKLRELGSNYEYYKRELFLSYYNTLQYKKADSLLLSIDKTTDSALRQIMNRYFGIVKYRVKDYNRAVQYLQNAVKDTVNLFMYSSALSRLQKFEDAMKILIPIIKSNPSNLNYNLNYGLSVLIEKKYLEAKAVFEKCEILAPKEPYVYFRWASFYSAQDQEKETLENIKKAFELGFKDLWRFEDEEFDSIRDKETFKHLVKEYFPDKK
jgi:tetratricopeptide (TPR) repeat protein